jgi:GTP-binding protein LepA
LPRLVRARALCDQKCQYCGCCSGPASDRLSGRLVSVLILEFDRCQGGMPVDAASAVIHRDQVNSRGRSLIAKSKKAIPRGQSGILLRAAVWGRILARETVKAFREDVTARFYRGDVTRKMKVLKKQKEGKRRMKSIGSMQIPQKAFMSVFDTSD